MCVVCELDDGVVGLVSVKVVWIGFMELCRIVVYCFGCVVLVLCGS